MLLQSIILSSSLLYGVVLARPAGPVAGANTGDDTADITLIQPSSTNLSAAYAPLIFPNNLTSVQGTTSGPLQGSPGRPGSNHIWPEVSSANFYIRFHDYKNDLDNGQAAAALYQAQEDVQGWIRSSKKGSYTPVEEEHYWKIGHVKLRIYPAGDGYLLGDLEKYIVLIQAFHTKYQEYWEWEAQLLRKGFMGILTAKGKAELIYLR